VPYPPPYPPLKGGGAISHHTMKTPSPLEGEGGVGGDFAQLGIGSGEARDLKPAAGAARGFPL